MKNPIETSCPHQFEDLTNCAAIAGEPCQRLPANEFHPERIEMAADESGEGVNITKQIQNFVNERVLNMWVEIVNGEGNPCGAVNTDSCDLIKPLNGDVNLGAMIRCIAPNPPETYLTKASYSELVLAIAPQIIKPSLFQM